MHEESLIPNPLGIPADSNQLGNPLVPLSQAKPLRSGESRKIETETRGSWGT